MTRLLTTTFPFATRSLRIEKQFITPENFPEFHLRNTA
jgi:hypothetical protein